MMIIEKDPIGNVHEFKKTLIAHCLSFRETESMFIVYNPDAREMTHLMTICAYYNVDKVLTFDGDRFTDKAVA